MRARRLIKRARAHCEDEFEREATLRYKPRSRLSVLSDTTIREAPATNGELRLLEVERLLEHGFAWSRYTFDRKLHDEMIKAAAPLIVGDDWDSVAEEVMRSRGWEYRTSCVCGKTARRMGKSVAISKMNAALTRVMLLSPGAIPDGETFTQAVFSTGLRASAGIKQYVMGFLAELGMLDYIIKSTDQVVILAQDPANPDSSPKVKLTFLPAKAEAYVFLCLLFCCCLLRVAGSWLFVFGFVLGCRKPQHEVRLQKTATQS